MMIYRIRDQIQKSRCMCYYILQNILLYIISTCSCLDQIISVNRDQKKQTFLPILSRRPFRGPILFLPPIHKFFAPYSTTSPTPCSLAPHLHSSTIALLPPPAPQHETPACFLTCSTASFFAVASFCGRTGFRRSCASLFRHISRFRTRERRATTSCSVAGRAAVPGTAGPHRTSPTKLLPIATSKVES